MLLSRMLCPTLVAVALLWGVILAPVQFTYDRATDTVTCEQTVGTIARCDQQGLWLMLAILALLLGGAARAVVRPFLYGDVLKTWPGIRETNVVAKLFDPIRQGLREGSLQPITYG